MLMFLLVKRWSTDFVGLENKNKLKRGAIVKIFPYSVFLLTVHMLWLCEMHICIL